MPIVDDTITDEKSFVVAAWFDTHPEASASIPGWANEFEFDSRSPHDGTVIGCRRRVGPITMWGQVKVDPDGSVLADGHVDLLFADGGRFGAHTPWQGMMVARGLASYFGEVAQILSDEDLA